MFFFSSCIFSCASVEGVRAESESTCWACEQKRPCNYVASTSAGSERTIRTQSLKRLPLRKLHLLSKVIQIFHEVYVLCMAAAASSSDPTRLPDHTNDQQEDRDVAVDVDHHEYGDLTNTLLDHNITSDRRAKVSRLLWMLWRLLTWLDADTVVESLAFPGRRPGLSSASPI